VKFLPIFISIGGQVNETPRFEKIKRWEFLKEKLNGNHYKLVAEFHILSQYIYGKPINNGRNKIGWSIEDSAKAINKSVSYVRRCLKKVGRNEPREW
jgi:ribosome-binding protein aMBF1 (putative translation factor)